MYSIDIFEQINYAVYFLYYTTTPERNSYLSMAQTYSHKKSYYNIHNYINNLKKTNVNQYINYILTIIYYKITIHNKNT